MKLGLVIGRFQPLHKGHISLINQALLDNDKVLVLIGSSNKLRDFKNPFTADERVMFISGIYENEPDLSIQTIKDFDTDDEWVQEVTARALGIQEDPTNVSIYCNPKDEEWYRSNFLFPVVTVKTVDISATKIRQWWYQQDYFSWDKFVPVNVLEAMDAFADFQVMQKEYIYTTEGLWRKTNGHPFGNPMEPVSFAVIIQEGHILVGKRKGPRGAGQFGLPGGFVENTESTLEASIRETKEELGVDLKALVTQGNAVCMAQAVSENLGDLGVRTLGVNYLFVIKAGVDLGITLDETETLSYAWVPYLDICEDKFLLFFNHNQITRQLLATVGNSK